VTTRSLGAAASDVLDAAQRRMLVGICILTGAVSLVPSTYNFILTPMLEGLDASDSQGTLLRQLPSIAALLVIFLASALSGRVGERNLIFAGSLLFTVGCIVVAIAPALPVATLGLVLLSAASSAMAVVGLGLLSSRVTNPAARATAFASFALVAPIAFMALPVAAGVILDNWSWRYVAAMWAIGGVILIWGVRRFIPQTPPFAKRPELATPALAGLTLAAAVQTISAISNDGILSTPVFIRAGITLVSATALILVFRRKASPSISLSALSRGGVLILLVVVMVVPFVNLWFYMTIEYQYVFGKSALETAVLMVPPQLAGVAGALVARKVIQRRGITFTGVAMLAGLAVALLMTLIIGSETPIWLIVAIMAGYALASVGAGVPVTNAIMNAAAAGEEGSASSFRGAAAHVGTALGVVVMSTIVYSAAANSIAGSLGNEGLASQESAQIAQSIRDGSSSEDVSAQYAVPIDEVDEIDDAQQAAMIEGLHAHGLSGALFISAAAAIFWFARRRQTIG